MPGELVSIVIPCRNEAAKIQACLRSVLAFTVPQDVAIEVLVVDGRSTDDTRRLIAEVAAADPRVRVVDNPRRTSPAAVNVGVGESRGQWIMRLDAHSTYPPDYLERCHETARTSGADNVGGWVVTEPGAATYSAELVQALTTHRFGVGNSGFRTGAPEADVDTVPFGFFRRDVFERVGRFDERLVRAGDYEFNRRIRASGGRVRLNPAIHASYFNQPSLGAFLRKQMVAEGPYNAYLWYCAPHAFAARHAVTAVFVAWAVFGCGLAMLARPAALAYVAIWALYASLAVWAAIAQARRYKEWRHACCLPVAFALFHLCHGIGVWRGLVLLAIGRAPVQTA